MSKYPSKYPSYTVNGADYIFAYGISGGIQSALEDVIWSCYLGACEELGVEPVSEDDFYEFYQDEASRFLARDVERDFIERFGLEWEI